MHLQAITSGQIVAVVTVLGICIRVPSWLVNSAMTWQGDDTWERRSSVFFSLIDLPSGNYMLRRIITGNGGEGPWFNRGWLNYRNDFRAAVKYTVFPRQGCQSDADRVGGYSTHISARFDYPGSKRSGLCFTHIHGRCRCMQPHVYVVQKTH